MTKSPVFNKIVVRLGLATALMASVAASALAQTIAITNAQVYTVAKPGAIAGGTVLIRDGRIAAVGTDVAVPADAKVIDAGGKPVTPGIFAPFARVGIVEVDAVDETNDVGARGSVVQAAITVADGFNPTATNIPVARIEGVTRAVIAPEATKDVFGGFGAIVSLGNGFNLIMRREAFQFAVLGEEGADLAGGSRGAAYRVLSNALQEAEVYAENRARYRTNGGDREGLTNHVDADALGPVVRGAVPLMVKANSAADLLQLIRLKQDFPKLRLIALGAAEGWRVADQLAAAKIPVILYALDNLPTQFETLAATFSNAGRLQRAGIVVTLGMLDRAAHQPRLLLQHAGNLVGIGRTPGGVGLSWDEALASITLNPARVFGMDKELGSLEVGKRADVVVWDGDPLELMSAPTDVFIDGQTIPLVSRQTELRDRYLNLDESTLPVGYRR